MILDLPDNVKWINDNLIYYVYAGSTSYGTDDDSSDLDYRGICIPTKKHYYGLDNFEVYHSSPNSGKDIVIYSLQRFMNLAIQNNPNVIEMLFVEPRHIIHSHSIFYDIHKDRHEFLSKQFFKRVNGYAKSQYHKMFQGDGSPNHGQGNEKRIEMRKKFGYDTKAASHLIRLLNEGLEVMETGNLNAYRPERQLLLDIKQGKYKINEIEEMYKELDEQLYNAYKNTSLPENPNYNYLNNLLIIQTEKYLLGR